MRKRRKMCGSEVQNKVLKQNILILPLSEPTDKRNHLNTIPFVFTSKVENKQVVLSHKFPTKIKNYFLTHSRITQVLINILQSNTLFMITTIILRVVNNIWRV